MASPSSEPCVVEIENPWSTGFKRILQSRWTFVWLQILDLLTTLYAFHAGAIEVNPLVARLAVSFGRFGGVLMSKVIAILIAMGVRRRLWIINVIYIVIVGWNLIMIAGMILHGK
jgi:uncharacterized protein DUF5658